MGETWLRLVMGFKFYLLFRHFQIAPASPITQPFLDLDYDEGAHCDARDA